MNVFPMRGVFGTPNPVSLHFAYCVHFFGDNMKRLVLKSIAAAVALTAIGMASAQDIKERTLKFAVAGPETHPAVPGMKKPCF